MPLEGFSELCTYPEIGALNLEVNRQTIRNSVSTTSKATELGMKYSIEALAKIKTRRIRKKVQEACRNASSTTILPYSIVA